MQDNDAHTTGRYVLDPTGTEGGQPLDGRLDSPSYHRNWRPILAVLRRVLGDTAGHALEVGSGAGQHISTYAKALPHLTWWPSDPNAAHRRSVDAWRMSAGAPNLMPAFDLDATSSWTFDGPDRPPAGQLHAVMSANVIHIAPWTVTEGLMAGAAQHLSGDGRLLFYGPFSKGGEHTAASNAAFDASLRAQDPSWGVRDIDDVTTAAGDRGLHLEEIVDMPSNNLMLIFARVPAG